MDVGHIAGETGHKKKLAETQSSEKDDRRQMRKERGIPPLHKWPDKMSHSQQIVLDSHKTSLMLKMSAQSTSVICSPQVQCKPNAMQDMYVCNVPSLYNRGKTFFHCFFHGIICVDTQLCTL